MWRLVQLRSCKLPPPPSYLGALVVFLLAQRALQAQEQRHKLALQRLALESPTGTRTPGAGTGGSADGEAARWKREAERLGEALEQAKVRTLPRSGMGGMEKPRFRRKMLTHVVDSCCSSLLNHSPSPPGSATNSQGAFPDRPSTSPSPLSLPCSSRQTYRSPVPPPFFRSLSASPFDGVACVPSSNSTHFPCTSSPPPPVHLAFQAAARAATEEARAAGRAEGSERAAAAERECARLSAALAEARTREEAQARATGGRDRGCGGTQEKGGGRGRRAQVCGASEREVMLPPLTRLCDPTTRAIGQGIERTGSWPGCARAMTCLCGSSQNVVFSHSRLLRSEWAHTHRGDNVTARRWPRKVRPWRAPSARPRRRRAPNTSASWLIAFSKHARRSDATFSY